MSTGRLGAGDTAIQPTIFDAKGDLLTATAGDTPARIAVGNNGETLVADSSATTGLRYTAGNSVGNPIINSAMQVWQRGTSFTATNVYTADRWYKGSAPAATYSRQATGDTTNLPNIQYCARVQRNSGSSATNGIDFGQNFESANSIPFAGKTITMSFYARAGANYSSSSSILLAQLYSGTGTDQNVFTGFTGQVAVISQNATLTTTWQRFSFSATVGATATQLAPYFQYSPTGTAGANDYFEITGVQIDIGSVALPFRTYAATLAGELAACQRYYQEIGMIHPCKANLTTNVYSTIQFNPMRAAPTLDLSDAYVISDPGVASYTQSAKNISIAGASNARGGMQIGMANWTGLTVGAIYYGNTATVRIQLSAEL